MKLKQKLTPPRPADQLVEGALRADGVSRGVQRAAGGEADQEVADWWTAYQQDPANAAPDDAQRPVRKKRRRRRRRRSRGASDAGSNTDS